MDIIITIIVITITTTIIIIIIIISYYCYWIGIIRPHGLFAILLGETTNISRSNITSDIEESSVSFVCPNEHAWRVFEFQMRCLKIINMQEENGFE